MRARVEKVSPSLARRWLETTEASDITQRGVRKSRVEKLVHAIHQGQWQVTHQGIALSDDGVVLDGQHRLHAIVQSGETVEMMVTRDVDPAVFGTIDTGASRTPADTLKIAGYSNTNILAAMLRTVLVYDRVKGTTGSDWNTIERTITVKDLLEYLEDPDRKDSAYIAMRTGMKIAGAVSRFGASTSLGAANLILNTYPTDVGPAARAEFNDRLCDGVMLPARSPILALRRWLVSDTGLVNVSHTIRRPVVVSSYMKAINDYALGEERSLSIFRFGSEKITEPLPKGARKKFQKEMERGAEIQEALDTVTGGGKTTAAPATR